ncbi:MAG: sn-glycerol-1-phosphate dehydrogenase [Ruminococcaceae bacterium]|nr:sn-glycerol-1-phosphate dehydrogenase [Oscillospiraceae bacterium]
MIIKEYGCACGRDHKSPVKKIISGSGAITNITLEIKKYNFKKAFILSDENTYKAAGKTVEGLFEENNIDYKSYVLKGKTVEPDERSVGAAIMHYDSSCDVIIGVGSGVINDIGKIVANVTKSAYIIVATAPSMDGYASSTSSMTMDGLKVSLSSKCADIIIGDTDILKEAPLEMLRAGLGDMVAKYISICEWKISSLILGEYYCGEIASLVKDALKKCTDNAKGLMSRDETAVKAVFDGLIICGTAMAYSGVSRPASGVEHYFSHVWDMRGAEFGTDVNLHGIQCAFSTYLARGLYEQVKKIVPDREKALKYAENFDLELWNDDLRKFLGKSAETMISQETKEGKYDKAKHKERLDKIINNWDGILRIIDEELPDIEYITELFKETDLPTDYVAAGVDKNILKMTFKATKDIRDKYVLSRLCWDLGIIEEIEF